MRRRGMSRKSIIAYVLCQNAPRVPAPQNCERPVLDSLWRLVTGIASKITIICPEKHADQDDQALPW
jgi:hypothetical protein